jgi:DNA-binding XRE family transcriptional regulator
MNSRKQTNKDAAHIFRVMREMLLEASETEIEELLKETGLDLESIGSKGLALAKRAIDQNKQSSPEGENYIVLHKGLNSLLIMLRRRDGLDEGELAQKADVDEAEIRKIECEPGYEANPRTIYKLEREFNLPSGVLAKLSGAIKYNSPCLEERVLEFAANAKSIGKLNRSERQLLAEFVKFLTENP